MDDVRAVMDAAGSERAVLFGVSEGVPMSLLFAATYPERTDALVLHGGMARSTWAPDYPWATPADALIESAVEFILPVMHTGGDLDIWMPTYADDPEVQAMAGRYRRSAASPAAVQMLFLMFLEIDVRHVLPAIKVPTLVLHRYGDRVVNRRAGEWMASQIPGAKYVELEGRDHFPWVGDTAAILAEIREFLTGRRAPVQTPDNRVLATVLFTDIVGSTERAATLGDAEWGALLARHNDVTGREVERFRGRKIKSLGDGFLATFDGPGRAIRCALAIRDAVQGLGLEVRGGLHSGEVEVTDDDVTGIAVHIASRICDVAGAGEVLVSSTVKGLVAGSDLDFEQRSDSLRDLADEWQVFAVRS
jgi:class 3 adenylate cyclase